MLLDWVTFRVFTEADEELLSTFVVERVNPRWVVNPRLGSTTYVAKGYAKETRYYVCQHFASGCLSTCKIVTKRHVEDDVFAGAVVYQGKKEHTRHPPFAMEHLEAYMDGMQVANQQQQ